LTQRERLDRLMRIARRIKEIDRQLYGLCPFLNRAAALNTERLRLANEARELTRGAPEA
jgi:hypothetical protein